MYKFLYNIFFVLILSYNAGRVHMKILRILLVVQYNIILYRSIFNGKNDNL